MYTYLYTPADRLFFPRGFAQLVNAPCTHAVVQILCCFDEKNMQLRRKLWKNNGGKRALCYTLHLHLLQIWEGTFRLHVAECSCGGSKLLITTMLLHLQYMTKVTQERTIYEIYIQE